MSNRPWILRQLMAVVHEQIVPLHEVTIQHNKEKIFPRVILINETGHIFETLVESIDENNIIIKMNRAVIFTAYIY